VIFLCKGREQNEGKSVGQEDVCQMQDHPPKKDGHGYLRKQKAQAKTGITLLFVNRHAGIFFGAGFDGYRFANNE
jgi:hypothetical protein